MSNFKVLCDTMMNQRMNTFLCPHVICGMVVEQEVCNSIQASLGIPLCMSISSFLSERSCTRTLFYPTLNSISQASIKILSRSSSGTLRPSIIFSTNKNRKIKQILCHLSHKILTISDKMPNTTEIFISAYCKLLTASQRSARQLTL